MEIASKVDSLHYHYRDDKLAASLSEIKNRLDDLTKKNGNGIRHRVRWLERMAWGLVGALAAFEFFMRLA